MATSSFAKKLATIAEGEYNKYRLQHEADPLLFNQIKRYWQDLGFSFPGVNTAWSAVFVSWCISKAGATSAEFKFNSLHAEFVYWAVKNAVENKGLFRAFDIKDYAPQIGDIIHNNRAGYNFNFQYAKTNNSYFSHSAIVIEKGIDSQGKYVLTVGGNESDSVGKKIVRLLNNDLIKQRSNSSFISVIQNLK